MAGATNEQREVYYSGRVQGVGFRYTVRSLAARYKISGYVKNLPDGRVYLVVEGPPADLDAFLEDICRTMGRYISGATVNGGPASNRFRGFEVRH